MLALTRIVKQRREHCCPRHLWLLHTHICPGRGREDDHSKKAQTDTGSRGLYFSNLLLNSRQYPTILLTTSTILSLFSPPLPTPKIPVLRVQHSQLFVKKINHFRVSSIPFTYWKMRWDMMGRGDTRGEAWTICGNMSQLCGWLPSIYSSIYPLFITNYPALSVVGMLQPIQAVHPGQVLTIHSHLHLWTI